MFFEVLVSLLGKHGVAIPDVNVIETGEVKIDIDFTEHDKVFEDKIARLEENVGYYKDSLSRTEKNCDKLHHENKELKQRIAELESKEKIIEVRVPASPIEIATHLINNTCTINELKMIAEHINVYCNGGK